MKRIIIAAAFATSPAAAQNAEDCTGRTFSLRPFPMAMVQAHISARDPNAYVRYAHGRCEPGDIEVSVCADVLRVNRAGYFSDQRVVFGVYFTRTGRFVPTLSGPHAPQACADHVYRD